MLRMVARLVVLLLVGLVIAIGGVVFDSDDSTDEVMVIKAYDAQLQVDSKGELTAVETVTVDFPVARHGIFRFFDTWDSGDAHNRAIPTDVKVTRDGTAEPFETLSQSRGRYTTLKIGSADRTISGTTQYQISYHMKGVLTPGTDGSRTQFYWDVIPGGWAAPIETGKVTVRLPAPAGSVRCAVGVDAGSGCTADGAGTETLTVGVSDLAPRTPVTVQAGMDIATPPANTRPWVSRLDPILGTSRVLLGLVLVAAAAAATFAVLLARSVREKEPPFPLMYAPPDGIGPAQAAYILTEGVKDTAFVASMLYAADRGAVALSQSGKDWTMRGIGDDAAWARTDVAAETAAKSLGIRMSGSSFVAEHKSVDAGEKLKSALANHSSTIKSWARDAGLMERSGLGPLGALVIVAAAALTFWLGAINPMDMSIVALIPGLFLVFGLTAGAPGAGTRRTATGRDLWSRIGGFKRVLATPSSEARFDFSGRQDLYTAYIPWAVAFNCADEWAKKYRIETGQEPPVPDYLPVYAGAHTANFVGQMVSSFDSAVSSAISSYQATQSSSGGGGGGFSGGGGGGGGGGGSW